MKFNRKTLLESKFTRHSFTNDLPHSALEEYFVSDIARVGARGLRGAVDTLVRHHNRQNFDQWGRPRFSRNQPQQSYQQNIPYARPVQQQPEPNPFDSKDQRPGLLARLTGYGNAKERQAHLDALDFQRREAEKGNAEFAVGKVKRRGELRALTHQGRLATTGANSSIAQDNAATATLRSKHKTTADVASAPEYGAMQSAGDLAKLKNDQEKANQQAIFDKLTPAHQHMVRTGKVNKFTQQQVLDKIAADAAAQDLTKRADAAVKDSDAGLVKATADAKLTDTKADVLGKRGNSKYNRPEPKEPAHTASGTSISPDPPVGTSPIGPAPASWPVEPSSITAPPPAPIPTSTSTPPKRNNWSRVGLRPEPEENPVNSGNPPAGTAPSPITKRDPAASRIRSKTGGIGRFTRQPRSSIAKPLENPKNTPPQPVTSLFNRPPLTNAKPGAGGI